MAVSVPDNHLAGSLPVLLGTVGEGVDAGDTEEGIGAELLDTEQEGLQQDTTVEDRGVE